MAEPREPNRKSKASEPPAPLPRLWKVDPPAEEEGGSSGKGKKKRLPAEEELVAAARPKKKKKADGTPTAEKRADGSTKIEETPKFDTYETRQRVRIIIGSLMGVVILILVVVVVRRFRHHEPVEVATGPDPRVKIAAEAKATEEQEARTLLGNAQLAAKNGRTSTALDLFDKVAKSYPTTVAAHEAMEALDRHRKKLPLLGPSPLPPTGPQTPPPGSNPVVALGANSAATPEPLGPKAPANPVDGATSPAPASSVPGPVRPLKPLPVGFDAKMGSRFHASGWPLEIIGRRDGAEMVFVAGGIFTMGRDDGELPERPAHRVKLAGFYIDRHEVTVRQYQQFIKETGRVVEAPRPTSKDAPEALAPSEDHPVVNVNARDARDYCRWAGKVLPTEAQWEMAARGEDGRIYPWGSTPPSWAPPRVPKQIDPVMGQPSDVSPSWAFDMAGNAWEWTGDIYDSRFFQQFRDTTAVDPVGPSQARSRPILVTVKGGSKTWQVFWRDGLKVEQRLPYLGFRGALQADKPETPVAAPTPGGRNPSAPVGPAPSGGVVPF